MIDLRLILLLIVLQKTCTRCGALKFVSDFDANKLGRFGRAAACKRCTSQRKGVDYAEGKMVQSATRMEML